MNQTVPQENRWDAAASSHTAYGQGYKGSGWLSRGNWTLPSIGAMVIGFMVFPPLGFGLLIYNMVGGSYPWDESWRSGRAKFKGRGGCGRGPRGSYRSSGNAAFDAYRERILAELEEDRRAFEDHLEALRQAKDKEEFDSFMAARAAHQNQAPGDASPNA